MNKERRVLSTKHYRTPCRLCWLVMKKRHVFLFLQLDGSLKSSQHISNQILSVLNTDRETDQVLGDAEGSTVLSRDGSVGHGGGQLAQGLDTSEGLGQGEELDAAQELVGSLQISLDTEGDHTAKALLLALGKGMLGVRGQTGVDDVLDTGRSLKSLGNGLGRGSVLAHTEVKGLETTVGEEAVKGRGNSSDRVLQEGELGEDLLIRGDSNTHDNIRVSVNVLGDRVDNDISAERERVLEVGAHEGVVDDQLGVVLVGNVSNGLDINEAQRGVGGGLDPDELGVGADDSGDIGGISKVNKGNLDSEGRGDLGEVTVGASIDVVDRDNVRSSREGADDGGGGGRSRREGQSVLGALEGSNGGLESVARGVSAARVVESLLLAEAIG